MSASPSPMTAVEPAAWIAELLPKLQTPSITYFPIRHHSPACAAHLARWIAQHRPASILIEGPGSMNELIPLLVHERMRCPTAVFVNFTDKKGRLAPPPPLFDHTSDTESENDGEPETEIDAAPLPHPTENDPSPDDDRPDPAAPGSPRKRPTGGFPSFGPVRSAAYYPFCDYSPELVALRVGQAQGARLRFIDLDYAEKVLHGADGRVSRSPGDPSDGDPSGLIVSLAADPHLERSRYIQELTRKMGCRDFDELWDHLFETLCDAESTSAFIDRLATYCAMSRFDYTADDLERDGTNAREACMAACIREELALVRKEKTPRPILVVTGGFHTVALPDLVAREVPRPKRPSLADGEAGQWLMRYSFDQLDSLQGYSAGMPTPGFYDLLWQAAAPTALPAERAAARRDRAAECLVEIGRRSRARQSAAVLSTPDVIAAVQMMKQLAMFRGHPWPQREDLLDGIRSCFVKGEMGVEGQLVMRLARELLAGNRVGELPPGAGQPPIVDDFLREARRLRLPVDAVERKEVSLELYRSETHRATSRFLHRLDFLGAPFAKFVDGPDFVTGQGLDRLHETWSACWSPAAESALIEASLFGPTVEEAALGKLVHEISHLEEQGTARSTETAVAFLIRACRLGLHSLIPRLVQLIDLHIAEDASFTSVVTGLSQLDLLATARDPLEAAELEACPSLMTVAYHRACRLLDDLSRCPDEAVHGVIGSLRTLREILTSHAEAQPEGAVTGGGRGVSREAAEYSPSPALASRTANPAPPRQHRWDADRDLFHDGLRRLLRGAADESQGAIVGAAAGVLFSDGRLGEDELIELVLGYLRGTEVESNRRLGILRGLLATAREVAWQVRRFIEALDTQFDAWDEATFLGILPELRLAFADLTPQEITRVADRAAHLHGETTLGDIVHTDVSEEDVHIALRLNHDVQQALAHDGFAAGTASAK